MAICTSESVQIWTISLFTLEKSSSEALKNKMKINKYKKKNGGGGGVGGGEGGSNANCFQPTNGPVQPVQVCDTLFVFQ